jgi:hypothetical protein
MKGFCHDVSVIKNAHYRFLLQMDSSVVSARRNAFKTIHLETLFFSLTSRILFNWHS